MNKIILYISLIFLISACKKSSTDFATPPENPNYEVKAMVAVKTSTFSSISAIGNSTLFVKSTDTNGDALISVLCSDTQGKIKMTLLNINAAETYIIDGGDPARTQYVIGTFGIGTPNILAYEFFLVSTPSASSGNIIIEKLTSTSIRGSFSMNCIGSAGSAQITNGTFKGTF